MQKPSPVIRQGRPDDLGRLADIETAAAALFPPGRLPEPPQTLPVATLREAMSGGLLWVLTVDDTPMGFAAAQAHRDAMHILEIDVHPQMGRRGLGTRLMVQLTEDARAAGFRQLTLTTFEDIPWNAPFYTRLGFSTIDRQALSPELAERLARESASGMDRRVAMALLL